MLVDPQTGAWFCRTVFRKERTEPREQLAGTGLVGEEQQVMISWKQHGGASRYEQQAGGAILHKELAGTGFLGEKLPALSPCKEQEDGARLCR